MDHRYKKFLAVVDTKSFSAAAKKLHVTQPAITFAVASLERAFGVKLIVRNKYEVQLTDEGKVVADFSKRMSKEFENMKIKLGNSSGEKQYQVGIIDSLALLLYSSSRDEKLLNKVDVMVDNSRRIISQISSNDIDAGLIAGQPTDLGKEIVVRRLHNEDFVFVCAPYLAPTEITVQIDDWLAYNTESTTYNHFVKVFKKAGLQITPVFYSTSMELLKEMAVAGKGTALLPKHIVQESIDNGTLEIVKTKPLNRPIWAIMKKENQSKILNEVTLRLDSLLSEPKA